jgi:hypothetical protein
MRLALLLLLFSAYAHASAEWTFLVFLNGNNNLDPYGIANLRQMETVGSTGDINIVVQWASKSATTTKRLLIQKSADPYTVTSPAVEEFPRADMGDYHVLQDFIRWGVQKYPAKRYFIDVWDHGGGWHRGAKEEIVRNISYDDFSGHSIDTVELGLAMEDAARAIGHKVDLYGSDACMMAMIEVADEMADSVSYFLGSEETEPGDGWPYDKVLRRWTASPTMSTPELTKVVTDEYVKYFQNGLIPKQVTLSSFDLSHMAAVERAIADFGENVKKLSPADAQKAVTAIFNSQRFYQRDYVDLGDYLFQIESSAIPSITHEAIGNASSALTGLIVDNQTTSGYLKATGATIWLPTRDNFGGYVNRYRKLKFAKSTGWDAALEWLVKNPPGLEKTGFARYK